MHDLWNLYRSLFKPEQLELLLHQWGWVAYIVLFTIIFVETGLLIAFLPGDSLLFVAGFVCAASNNSLRFWPLILLLSVAAIIGDTVSFWIGKLIGPHLFTKEDSIIFNRRYIQRTHEFYERHGGKTIILARFVPVIRTFAPVVAGVGKMDYKKFLSYNIFGGVGWILSMMSLGYWLGQIEFVKKNLEKAVILVVIISILPIVFEYIKSRRRPAESTRV